MTVNACPPYCNRAALARKQATARISQDLDEDAIGTDCVAINSLQAASRRMRQFPLQSARDREPHAELRTAFGTIARGDVAVVRHDHLLHDGQA